MGDNSQAKKPRPGNFNSQLPLAFIRMLKSSQKCFQFRASSLFARRFQYVAVLLLILGFWQFFGTWSISHPKVEEKKDVPKPEVSSSSFDNKLSGELQKKLKNYRNQNIIPVVQFYARPGKLPCKREHYIYRNLQQAKKYNSLVYFIGPDECKEMAHELNITLDPYGSYKHIFDWFSSHIGKPIGYQVRWFVLRAFMERHGFGRVFYTDSDVLLFANITEAVNMLYPNDPLVLAVRWPSLDPPGGPSQYTSTSVSGHVSLWSHAALVDFLNFFKLFFELAVLTGTPNPSLVTSKAYNDMVPLGWYTFQYCWVIPPNKMKKQCMADKASGVTPERSARIRGKFRPKFKVTSFCEPKLCNSTSWSDSGWCAFDNNFSVQTPTQFFHFLPKTGMKCPTSMHYTYFMDWRPTEKQTQPVQFLAVHFQAHKKGYISRNDDPATTWGSSAD